MSFFPLTHLSNKAQISVDEPAPFKLLNPKTVEEAVRMLNDHGPEAVVLAGGCDILEKIKTQWVRPKFVVNLKSINNFIVVDGIKLTGERLKEYQTHFQGKNPDVEYKFRQDNEEFIFTARDTLFDVESSRTAPTALRQAARRVASPQIRNIGTLVGNVLQDSRCPYYRGPWNCYRAGGNTCDAVRGYTHEHALWGGERCYTVSPSDTAPALVALESSVDIISPRGRRTTPIENLFVLPSFDIKSMHSLAADELIVLIEVPPANPRGIRYSAFHKAAQRNTWDFALASCAIAAHMDGERVSSIRVVLGAVAPTPHRALEAEKILVGTNLKDHIEDAVLASVSGAEPLPHNHYKIGLVKNLVRECLEDIVLQNKI